MACPPQLVSKLIVEISNSDNFAIATTLELPASTTAIPVNGAYGDTKYVRSKWQRTPDVEGPPAIPAEESGWSNTVACTFPRVPADALDRPPVAILDNPPVPIVRAVYGWKEFIEVVLGNAGQESIEIFYAGTFGTGSSTGKCGLGVKNLSGDPTIAIEQVDFIMGANAPNVAGLLSFDADPLDTAPLTYPYQAIHYNFTTIDPDMPGTPPKKGLDYFTEFLGSPIPKWVKYKLCPRTPGSSEMVCPQDADSPCTSPAYFCQDSYFGARLRLTEFSESARGVKPQLLVQLYARSLTVYIDALGATVFPPQLPAIPSPGYYGSFQGNLPAQGPAVIKVKFSTGVQLELNAYPIGVDATGLRWTAPTEEPFVLDDFFLFISESSFSETLDTETGDWWDALGDSNTQPTLPSGVYMVRLGRETNLLASNLGGVRLQAGKTYYFRVGARRPTSFTQKSPDYLYSATLSALHTGRLGSSTADANINDPGLDTIVAMVDGEPQPVKTLIPGTGIDFELSGNELTISADSLESQGVYEESGFLFVIPGAPAVGSDATFKLVAPCDGTFTDWVILAKTAPQGAAAIIDIHMDGASIWNNGSTRATLPALSTSATGTEFFTPTFLKGQVLRCDVDQVGSTIAGERLQLQVNYRGKLKQ